MQEHGGLVRDFWFGNGPNIRQELATKFQGNLKGEEGSCSEKLVPFYQNTGIHMKMRAPCSFETCMFM
jgi:hypothetical protein